MGSVLVIAMVFAQAEPIRHSVAIVCDVRGSVFVQRVGDERRAAVMYQALFKGDRIQVEDGSSIAMAFSDGTVQRNAAGGELTVTAMGCEPKSAVKSSVLKVRDNPRVQSTLKELIQRGGAATTVLRSGPASVVTHAPLDNSLVLTGRPTLKWDPVPAAHTYRVRVREATSREPFLEQEVREPKFVLSKLVTEGSAYSWSVIANLPDDEVKLIVDSTFTVARRIDIPALGGLQEGAQTYVEDDGWLLAEALRRSQLFDAALPFYERLAAAHPADETVRAILAELYSRAGEYGKADSLKKQELK
jgi:hypothetical protein